MTNDAPARFYLPWLDGVRAFSTLLVLVCHAAILPGQAGVILPPLLGSFAVYVFLALSAFLLTRLLRLEWQATGRIALLRFWTRRALRVWPLYTAFGLAACAWALWVEHWLPGRVLGLGLVHFTVLQDVCFPLFGWTASLPYAAPLWTISIEEQAYLLLPLVLLAYFAGGGSRRLAVALVAIAMAGAAARAGLVLLGAEHVSLWTSPLHPDAFLAGMWLGLDGRIGEGTVGKHRHGPLLLLAVPMLLGLVAFLGPPIVSRWAEVYAYPVLALAALSTLLAVAATPRLAALLGARPLRHLGRISYGIYVFHFAAIAASDRLMERVGIDGSVLRTSLTLVISVLVAEISYRVLERPFLKLKDRFTVIPSLPVA